MTKLWIRRGLITLRLVVLCLLGTLILVGPAWAKSNGIGWIGLSRDIRVEGYWGTADYSFGGNNKGSGSQIVLNFEGAFLGKVTPLGNLGGVEFGMNMGYDGGSSSEAGDDSKPMLGGFAYDISVGFPITLFHHMSGGRETLQVGIAPGFGVNHLHAYATYLKAKAAMAIGDGMAAELQWQWWPGGTSSTMFGGSTNGLNLASLKGTVFMGSYGDKAFLVFTEYLWGQVENEQSGKGNPGYFAGENPFTTTTRADFGTVFRLGGGMAF